MPQENVEIVRSFYEAANRADWDEVFRDVDPDFELTTPAGLDSGVYRGRDECQGFWQEMSTAFEGYSFQPEEFIETGDQVVVVVKSRLRPKGSSADIERRTATVWTLRAGKAVSLRIFRKPKEALEAVGLSEQDAHADS
jgi:ketosteroid isomerase-like protein